MKTKETITKPTEIIPKHLQHNNMQWHKKHMAGKQEKNLKRNGIGLGIIQPKIKKIKEIFAIERIELRNERNAISKEKRELLIDLFKSKDVNNLFHKKGKWKGKPKYCMIGRIIGINHKTVMAYCKPGERIKKNVESKLRKRKHMKLEEYREEMRKASRNKYWKNVKKERKKQNERRRRRIIKNERK